MTYLKYVTLLAMTGFGGLTALFLVNPNGQLGLLKWLVAAALILGGLSEAAALMLRDRMDRPVLGYLQVAVTLLAGGALFAYQAKQETVFVLTLLAFWLLLSAGLQAGLGKTARKDFRLWPWVSAGLYLVLAVLLLLHPVLPRTFTGSLLALIFGYQAVLSLGRFIQLNRLF